jgi:hypothetical protein
MLGDRRLGDAEVPLDHRNGVPGRTLARGEQFQDATPNGISENIERVHQPSSGGSG